MHGGGGRPRDLAHTGSGRLALVRKRLDREFARICTLTPFLRQLGIFLLPAATGCEVETSATRRGGSGLAAVCRRRTTRPAVKVVHGPRGPQRMLVIETELFAR